MELTTDTIGCHVVEMNVTKHKPEPTTATSSQQQFQDQENDRDKIIAELTRANGILKANISTLYRTARAEIARKNDRIVELQSEVDDLLFKRMNRATKSGQQPQQQHKIPVGTLEPSTSTDLNPMASENVDITTKEENQDISA